MEELKILLLRVPDSYEDFVEGVTDEAEESEKIRIGLVDFLKERPKATSSEVIKYMMDDLGLYEECMRKSVRTSQLV